MRNVKAATLAGVLVGALAAVGGVGCGSSSSGGDDSTIKVGQNIELSGFESFFGKSKQVGAAVAVDDINAQGGIEIDGETHKLELVAEDNRTNATTAVSAAEKLADEGVILSFAPDQGFDGVYQINQGSDIITLGSGGPTVAKLIENASENPLLFNEFPLFDAFVGGHLQQIKYLHPEAKTIAALLPDDPNGQGFLPLFEQLAPKYGLTFVGAEFHPPTATGDFTSYLTKLKQKRPDVLYTGLFPQHSVPATEQAAQLDVADILTADFLLPKDLAGTDLRGHPMVLSQQSQVFADGIVPKGTAPLVKKFESEAKGGDFLSGLAVNAYVDIWLLKDALEKAGTTDDGTAVAKALTSATYEGPFGPASVDKNHAFDLSVNLLQIDGDKVDVYTFPSMLAAEPTSHETVARGAG